MGHRQRMDETRNSKKIYQVNLHHKLSKGRHKARGKDDVGDDIRKKGIVNRRQVAQERDGWQLKRCLSFLDSEAIEEEEKEKVEEVCPLNYICIVNMEYKKHHGTLDFLKTQRMTTSLF